MVALCAREGKERRRAERHAPRRLNGHPRPPSRRRPDPTTRAVMSFEVEDSSPAKKEGAFRLGSTHISDEAPDAGKSSRKAKISTPKPKPEKNGGGSMSLAAAAAKPTDADGEDGSPKHLEAAAAAFGGGGGGGAAAAGMGGFKAKAMEKKRLAQEKAKAAAAAASSAASSVGKNAADAGHAAQARLESLGSEAPGSPQGPVRDMIVRGLGENNRMYENEDKLLDLFRRFGDVERVSIEKREQDGTGYDMSYALVTFVDTDGATKAMYAFNPELRPVREIPEGAEGEEEEEEVAGGGGSNGAGRSAGREFDEMDVQPVEPSSAKSLASVDIDVSAPWMAELDPDAYVLPEGLTVTSMAQSAVACD